MERDMQIRLRRYCRTKRAVRYIEFIFLNPV